MNVYIQRALQSIKKLNSYLKFTWGFFLQNQNQQHGSSLEKGAQ